MPRSLEDRDLVVAEVVADRADDADVGEEADAARAKWTAEPPSICSRSPNGVLDGVKGNGSDNGERHERGMSRIDCGGDACGADQRVRRPRGARGGRAARSRVRARARSLVEVARAGMNFADTHQRHNDYLAKAELPLIPGVEVSGRTADGRRVAAIVAHGRLRREGRGRRGPRSSRCPTASPTTQAAAILAPGTDAPGRCCGSAPGSRRARRSSSRAPRAAPERLIVQLAKSLGAGVIAFASSAEKRELALGSVPMAAVDSRSEELG